MGALALRLFSLTLLVLFVFATATSSAQPRAVIIAPGLTMQDFQNTELRKIAAKSSFAYLSPRIGRAQSIPFADEETNLIASSYLTIATGTRSAVGLSAAQIYNRGEIVNGTAVENVYKTFGGDPASANLLAPNFFLTERQTRGSTYPGEVGKLYQEIDKPNAIVIGNADYPGHIFRPIGFFGIGTDGKGAGGLVNSSLLTKDRKFPFGVKTSIAVYREAVENAARNDSLVFIDCSDLTRFLMQEPSLSESARQKMRAVVIQHAASMIAIADNLFTEVCIVSPLQSLDPKSAGADRLGLFVYPEGPGVLKGNSTRRLAALANTDIARAILHLDNPRSAVPIGDGRDFSVVRMSSLEAASEMDRVYHQALFQSSVRTGVYIFVWVSAALLFALSLLSFSDSRIVTASSAAGFPVVWMLSMLAVSILMPNLLVFTSLSAIGAILAWVAIRLLGSRWALELLAVIAIGSILTALSMGLHRFAAGSYELQGGARFYGIGNEYAGLLTGAVLFLASMPVLASRWYAQAAALLLALVCALVLGHPSFGANAGDMLGCLAGIAALTAVNVFRGKLLAFAALGLIAVVMLFGFAIQDASQPLEKQSHIGKAIGSFANSGAEAIVDIAVRKVSLNAMLLRNSPWAFLLVAAVSGGLVCWLRRSKEQKRDAARVLSLGIAMAVLLLANDSGALSAAACGLWLFAACAGGVNICEKRRKFV